MTQDTKAAADSPPPQGDARSQPATNSDAGEVVGPHDASSRLFARHRWIGFVLPLVVYMLAGQLEQLADDPSAPPAAASQQADPFADDVPINGPLAPGDSPGANVNSPEANVRWYPFAYALRISLTLAAMVLVLPVYRQFKFRASWLAFGVGIVGAPIWIGLCHVQRNFVVLPEPLATWFGGARAAYDPLAELGDLPALLAGFLAVRFFGLVLVVPIIEEFFLRGFLARYVDDADWWKLPIGAVSITSIATIVAYAAISHPSEILAAVAWFLLVTWLVARTKNIWDAVLAHATTNLLLGAWVLTTKQFWLW